MPTSPSWSYWMHAHRIAVSASNPPPTTHTWNELCLNLSNNQTQPQTSALSQSTSPETTNTATTPVHMSGRTGYGQCCRFWTWREEVHFKFQDWSKRTITAGTSISNSWAAHVFWESWPNHITPQAYTVCQYAWLDSCKANTTPGSWFQLFCPPHLSSCPSLPTLHPNP